MNYCLFTAGSRAQRSIQQPARTQSTTHIPNIQTLHQATQHSSNNNNTSVDYEDDDDNNNNNNNNNNNSSQCRVMLK